MRKSIVFFACLLEVSLQGAPLRNLDFEEANTNNLRVVTVEARPGEFTSYALGSVTDLLPGWGLFERGNRVETIRFNAQVGDSTDGFFGLIGSDFIDGRYPFLHPLASGSFGIFVEAQNAEFELIQRGEVPPQAEVLIFDGLTTPGSLLSVAMNNELLGSRSGIFGFIVTPFAGKEVELKLTFSSTELYSSFRITDGLIFLVPEPATSALFGLGLVCLLGFCWMKRRAFSFSPATSSAQQERR